MGATLDWAGCATFWLTIDDVVIFLDAYLDRVSDAPQSGLAVADVRRADWILVGHSHFDHLWGAERIAPQTGATIIGSYETVRIMAAHGVPETQLLAVSGGERIRLAEGIVLSVFPSLHSCAWSCTSMPQSDAVCLGDLDVEWHEQRDRLAAFKQVVMREHLSNANQGIRGDGGALVFLIETPHGSLFYQDTSGHWTGTIDQLRPDVAILAAAGRGNIDGRPIQGTLAEFVGRQAGLLQPKRILLCHHDNSMPGFSVTTDVGPIREAIESTVPGAELVEIGYLSSYPLFD